MHATLWHGTDETSALRRTILKDVFDAAAIPLDVVSTQDELLAVAARSRRASDHDFLLVDCAIGSPSDVDRCVAIATRTPLPIHIIHPSEEIVRAIEGAAGRPLVWLPATFSPEILLATLHALKAQVVAEDEAALEKRPAVTPREREVLALMAHGLDNHTISTRLSMSTPTVKSHVQRIMRKLGLTRAQIIARFGAGDETG